MTYEKFIELKRVNQPEENYQSHHIVPVCIGGTNNTDNLINLSYTDHYIAHMLLADENPDNEHLVHAFKMLGTLEAFLSKCNSLSKPKTDEHKFKLAFNHSGNNSENGKRLTDDEKLLRIELRNKEKQRKLNKSNLYYEYNTFKKQISDELQELQSKRLELEEQINNSDNCHIRASLKAEIRQLIARKKVLHSLQTLSLDDYIEVNNK